MCIPLHDPVNILANLNGTIIFTAHYYHFPLSIHLIQLLHIHHIRIQFHILKMSHILTRPLLLHISPPHSLTLDIPVSMVLAT